MGLRPLAASPGRQGRERFALLTIPLSTLMLGAYLSPVGWGIGRHRVLCQGLLQCRVRQFYSCRCSWPHPPHSATWTLLLASLPAGIAQKEPSWRSSAVFPVMPNTAMLD